MPRGRSHFPPSKASFVCVPSSRDDDKSVDLDCAPIEILRSCSRVPRNFLFLLYCPVDFRLKFSQCITLFKRQISDFFWSRNKLFNIKSIYAGCVSSNSRSVTYEFVALTRTSLGILTRTQRKSVERRVGGIKSVCFLFESVLKNITRIEEHRTCSLTNAHRRNWMLLSELAISGKPSHHDWKTYGEIELFRGKRFSQMDNVIGARVIGCNFSIGSYQRVRQRLPNGVGKETKFSDAESTGKKGNGDAQRIGEYIYFYVWSCYAAQRDRNNIGYIVSVPIDGSVSICQQPAAIQPVGVNPVLTTI